MSSVELLFFDGCPGYERVLPLLHELVAELQPSAEVRLRRIGSQQQAEETRFLGSPSVRVDGADVEPGAGDRSDFGLKCRLYASADGLQGQIPERWLRTALGRGD